MQNICIHNTANSSDNNTHCTPSERYDKRIVSDREYRLGRIGQGDKPLIKTPKHTRQNIYTAP